MTQQTRLCFPAAPHGLSAPEALHYKAAALAAKLADTCVSASFLPDLWSAYDERFHGVLSAELTGRD
jgi:hypothetical protein